MADYCKFSFLGLVPLLLACDAVAYGQTANQIGDSQIRNKKKGHVRLEFTHFSGSSTEEASFKMACRNAIDVLWESAGKPKLPTIVIRSGRIRKGLGPFTRYKLSGDQPFAPAIVLLRAKPRNREKIIFQMGHEFGHVLAGPGGHAHVRWLEESLCECAALFALRENSRIFSDFAELESEKQYARSLAEYADRSIRITPPVKSLSKWYADHANYLMENATDYDFNLPASVAFLRYFEQNPTAWETIENLNRGPARSSLSDHLTGWRSRVSYKHKKHVKAIADMLGVKLKEVH